MEKVGKYVRVGAPDKDKLAELVLAAIGPSRNRTDFAKELKVNPSTISRIINKKNSGASSDALILAIAKHADPVSGVTEEMLMEAHGMIKETYANEQERWRYDRYVYEKYTENAIRLLTSEILARGYSINSVKNTIRYPIVKGVGLAIDTVYMTSAVGMETGKWGCEVINPRIFQYPTGIHYDSDSRRANYVRNSRVIFDRIARVCALSYTSMIEPEDIVDKYSMVFSDEEAYLFYVEAYKDFSVPVRISFILLDLEHGRVKEEYNLCCNGRREDNFFVPIKREEKYDENDDFQYFFFFDEQNIDEEDN